MAKKKRRKNKSKAKHIRPTGPTRAEELKKEVRQVFNDGQRMPRGISKTSLNHSPYRSGRPRKVKIYSQEEIDEINRR